MLASLAVELSQWMAGLPSLPHEVPRVLPLVECVVPYLVWYLFLGFIPFPAIAVKLNCMVVAVLQYVLVVVMIFLFFFLEAVAVFRGLARCRVGVCRRETREGPSGR